MAQFSDLYPDIRGDVPMATDFSIKRAIQHTAAEFFGRTGCWKELIDPIVLIKNESRYDLDGPEPNARTDKILKCVMKENENTALSHVREQDIVGQEDQSTGEPRHFAHTLRGDLLLHPTPGSDEDGKDLQVFVVSVPTRNATFIPDTLMEKWRDGLVYGTKSRLMESRRQPWSDPEGAAYFHQLYMRVLREAKREGLTGNQANLTATAQPFGGRRTFHHHDHKAVN